MKDFTYLTIISLLILFISVRFYMDAIEEGKLANEIHFIWNDDQESIPKDSSLIRIEFTDKNNVYIGPVEPKIDTLMKQWMDKQHLD